MTLARRWRPPGIIGVAVCLPIRIPGKQVVFFGKTVVNTRVVLLVDASRGHLSDEVVLISRAGSERDRTSQKVPARRSPADSGRFCSTLRCIEIEVPVVGSLITGRPGAVKSPANSAVVGTVCRDQGAGLQLFTFEPKKKNVLSFRMGPPIVPPNWFWIRGTRASPAWFEK